MLAYGVLRHLVEVAEPSFNLLARVTTFFCANNSASDTYFGEAFGKKRSGFQDTTPSRRLLVHVHLGTWYCVAPLLACQRPYTVPSPAQQRKHQLHETLPFIQLMQIHSEPEGLSYIKAREDYDDPTNLHNKMHLIHLFYCNLRKERSWLLTASGLSFARLPSYCCWRYSEMRIVLVLAHSLFDDGKFRAARKSTSQPTFCEHVDDAGFRLSSFVFPS